ncbi:MAG: o-succinylbenzoate synthase [Crenarchaeota archaeon]|nr:o-succinylbenzoate synthase [Thermoproteota archaeon]MCR8455296.1 o-succinylbenzoate synthase [Thermoproteota archaeon]MCR8500778.1 o-succinylbenzoate synthase [Thermoproteota archaeon]
MNNEVSITIDQVILRHIRVRLKEEFKTSFGKTFWRDVLIVELHSDDFVGYGEVAADLFPGFSYETSETALLVLKKFLIPRILNKQFSSPRDFRDSLEIIRGHPIAKCSLEYAFWDLYAKVLGEPLYRLYGGAKTRVPVGVSIGIIDKIQYLIELIQKYVEEGYCRIKLKIAPGYDIEVLKAVREVFPEVALQVDANASYDISKNLKTLLDLDKFNLLMIEQPLHYYDLVDHARLRPQLKTPICLDESIGSVHSAEAAIALGSCDIINIKPPRVGGIIESFKIHNLCVKNSIGTWIGGMLETGIGKAHLLHIASLPNITYPSDISASNRYWLEDIIDPPHKLNSSDGTISVPNKPGIGVDVDMDRLLKYQIRYWKF